MDTVFSYPRRNKKAISAPARLHKNHDQELAGLLFKNLGDE